MTGVDPVSVPGRRLCRVLDQLAVLLPESGGRAARAGIAALTEAVAHDPEGDEVRSAWDQVVRELARLDGGCVAGPLPALVFDEMTGRPPGLQCGSIDPCLAHAVEQAALLLTDCDGWGRAAEVLVDQAERSVPDRLEVCLALGTVCQSLGYMAVTGSGGAVAELLCEWLDRVCCSEPSACGCSTTTE